MEPDTPHLIQQIWWQVKCHSTLDLRGLLKKMRALRINLTFQGHFLDFSMGWWTLKTQTPLVVTNTPT